MASVLLTLDDVAERTKISRNTLNRWGTLFRQDGKMPETAREFCRRLTRVGKGVRITEEAFEDWVQCPKHAATSTEGQDQALHQAIQHLVQAAELLSQVGLKHQAGIAKNLARMLEPQPASPKPTAERTLEKTTTEGPRGRRRVAKGAAKSSPRKGVA